MRCVWRACSCSARLAVAHPGPGPRTPQDIHMEMQVDCADELEIGAVKTQIKKGMGADYDMGSNSRYYM